MSGAFIQWWHRLEGLEQVLWCLALLFSFLFVLQTAMSFFMDTHDGNMDSLDDALSGDDAASFFSVRHGIAFFTLFGWSALAVYHSGISTPWIIAIGIGSGYFTVVVLYFLTNWISRLRQSGTLQMTNAVSGVGETYLRIPAGRTGTGKVHVQVQGRLSELEAMTDDKEDIATGKPVKVIGTVNDRILLVTTDFIKY